MTVLSTLAACTTGRIGDHVDTGVIEYLDPGSAATIDVVPKPVVLARERPELAANVRDYATLAAVAVNRSGDVSYYLVTYFWSTVDARSAAADALEHPSPVLLADDRHIELVHRVLNPQSTGMSVVPLQPPGVITQPMVYPITLETLRFIAQSRSVSLRASAQSTDVPYLLWQDQRHALLKFVAHMMP